MNKLIGLVKYAPAACAIHCLAVPVLIAVFPAIGLGFLLDQKIEFALMIGAILISLCDMCWGIRKHYNFFPLLLLVAGTMWWRIGHLSHHHTLFVSVGISCFVASNLLNRYLCKTCHACNHD